MKRRSIFKLLGLALPSTGTFAQTASGRAIRLVVPLSAGTTSDFVARLIAPHLSANLGQSVVVENKAGANGVIGVQDVLRSPPDGNTLLLGSVSPLAINMALVKNLPYDPRRDLTPIASGYSANHVWTVKSTFPARTMAEFIAYAKQNPGRVSIGHSSSLVMIQISALAKMAGIEVLPVPYKVTGATITDVLGGTLDVTLLDANTAAPLAKSGQIRVLGVSSLKRNPITPDWPAISETVSGFDFSSWSALVGPPGMPRDVVNKINAAMANALKQKEVLDKFQQAGIVPWISTPDELKAHIDAEVTKWIKLARDANIQPE